MHVILIRNTVWRVLRLSVITTNSLASQLFASWMSSLSTADFSTILAGAKIVSAHNHLAHFVWILLFLYVTLELLWVQDILKRQVHKTHVSTTDKFTYTTVMSEYSTAIVGIGVGHINVLLVLNELKYAATRTNVLKLHCVYMYLNMLRQKFDF
jgi:hypothetical protein